MLCVDKNQNTETTYEYKPGFKPYMNELPWVGYKLSIPPICHAYNAQIEMNIRDKMTRKIYQLVYHWDADGKLFILNY